MIEKVIVITGASSGLGAELAQQLSAPGVALVLFARRETLLLEIAKPCRQQGAEVLVVAGDVCQQADCQRLMDEAVAAFGGIDILINNAGLSMWTAFEDLDDLSLMKTLVDVNYLGNVYCCYYALPYLKKSSGMMVSVSSVQGRLGVPYHTGYAAAKHAVQGFYDSLRIELGDRVGILLVSPGWIAGTGLRAARLDKDNSQRGKLANSHSSSAVPVSICAKKIIQAIRLKKKELVVPGYFKFLFLLRGVSLTVINKIMQWKFKI
jgi:short-subunit dehydrogenase